MEKFMKNLDNKLLAQLEKLEESLEKCLHKKSLNKLLDDLEVNNVDKENEVAAWIGSIQEYSDDDEGRNLDDQVIVKKVRGRKD